jgi:hypothetical protein
MLREMWPVAAGCCLWPDGCGGCGDAYLGKMAGKDNYFLNS